MCKDVAGRAAGNYSLAACAPQNCAAKLAILCIFRFLRFRVFGTIPKGNFDVMELGEAENEKRFFPSGAIFFFALLIVFYAALWLVVYWLMIMRA